MKTLHPALHGGILARRDRPDDMAELERHGLGLVDLVVVNLYPFVKAAANPATSFEALVEEIDIGGPSLVRAAAKNFRGVLVVVDPADYPRLLEAVDESPSLAFRYELARKAIAHTAAYDTAITATLATVDVVGDRFERRLDGVSAALADHLDLSLDKIRDLRYGENPHQRAAWYRDPAKGGAAAGLGEAAILQGKELSYTNLLDLDAAARLVLEFDEPAAAVIKHTNPCGAATGASPAEAYLRARDADSLAAFGGIVALNRPVDAATAGLIVSTFIEAVIAPAVDDAAREILARKANMRVVTADLNLLRSGGVEVRSILGAVLAQERDRVTEAHEPWSGSLDRDGLRIVTKRPPTTRNGRRFDLPGASARTSSRTLSFTDAQWTGHRRGPDEPRRCGERGGDESGGGLRSLTGRFRRRAFSVPWPEALPRRKTAVVQPGGSVKDGSVIEAADQHNLARCSRAAGTSDTGGKTLILRTKSWRTKLLPSIPNSQFIIPNWQSSLPVPAASPWPGRTCPRRGRRRSWRGWRLLSSSHRRRAPARAWRRPCRRRR